ncbi:MAG: TlpA family protein disulfide reductase [Gammaproteobacteria bacterium]|nr:TlpA family protein disulfide reductase [Gammaproteobacteria bacterium]
MRFYKQFSVFSFSSSFKNHSAGYFSLLGFLVVFCAVIIISTANATEKFSLADLNGKEHKLADEKGKWVIINYWATWCPPCVEEIPELIFFHDKHKNKDAIVWGVNFEDVPTKTVTDFLEEYMVSYSILLAEPGKYSYFGPMKGLPTTYFISPEGKLVHTKVGKVTVDYLEEIMKKYGK